MQLNRAITLVLPLAAGMGIATQASATSIVHWEGDYVSQTLDTQATVNAASGGHVWATETASGTGRSVKGVTWTSALNPVINATPGADHYAGDSAAFYGTVTGGRLGNDGTYNVTTVNFSVVDNGAADRLRFDIVESSNNRAGAGAALWDQSGFLNGGDALTLGLDPNQANSIGQIALQLETVGPHVRQLRVLLRNDDTYYVSDLIDGFTPTANAAISVTGATLATTAFWQVDLVEGAFTYTNINGPAKLGTSMTGATLNDITGVGFAFSSGTSEDSKLNAVFELSSFEVTAVIPEPAALGWLGILLPMAVRRGRRHLKGGEA